MNKISVIIPIYNVEKYLDRCIKSILNQSYTNFEIVLVDDGSTDNSPLICDNYIKMYDNIFGVHKKNAGLGMARNSGLDIANGEYIVFIDADDWCDACLLENLIKYKHKHKVETVISGLKRVDDKGNVKNIENKYNEECFYGEDVVYSFLPRIIGRSPQKRDSLAVSSCAVLYSKKIIDKYNIRFESERKYLAEDLLFNIDYYRYAQSVSIAPVYDYNYFINSGTLTTKYRPQRTEKYVELYYLEKKKLMEIGIYEQCKLRLSCQYFLRIRNCIKQEQIHISGFSRNEAIENIHNICSQPLYRELIKSYPIWKLGMKRMMFLFFIKLKASGVLYILARYM